MWRLLVLIADSTNLIIHFDCRGSGLLLWFWGRSHLGVLSPCGAGVKPKNLAGAFTLRCHLTVPESCVAPARSHLADSTNLIIHHACRGSELLFLWLWGRSHLAVLSPCGAGSNLRTLLVLSPCGACHLTVPESCVAPARSHLAHSPSLIIPDACRGSGILLLCLWGRAHLAALGSNLRTLLPEPRIGSRIQKIFSWERILKHRHSDSIRSQLHWHNASF